MTERLKDFIAEYRTKDNLKSVLEQLASGSEFVFVRHYDYGTPIIIGDIERELGVRYIELAVLKNLID
jgi:hypothetical protein